VEEPFLLAMECTWG